MHFDAPPYADRYPELLQLYDDDPAIPKNNRIRRNISFAGWRKRDFTVDAEIAEKIGFDQIPFRQIGLYCDAYRKQLPPPKISEPDFRTG